MDLPKINDSANKYLMQNLSGTTVRPAQFLNSLNGRLHWYDKKINRPGRKLGHVNYIGNDIQRLKTMALADQRKIKI